MQIELEEILKDLVDVYHGKYQLDKIKECYESWRKICDVHSTLINLSKSALLRRLLEDKPIYPMAPPCSFSYPWYSLLDNQHASAYLRERIWKLEGIEKSLREKTNKSVKNESKVYLSSQTVDDRTKKLIALATNNPNLEESRTAAVQACKRISKVLK